MKNVLLIILTLLPIALGAQSFTLNHPTAEFDKRLLIAEPSGINASNSTDTLTGISEAVRKGFTSAGKSLRFSKWMQFSANILGYATPLLGLTKETTRDRLETREEIKLNSLGYVLGVGALTSSLTSTFAVGQAGGKLKAISSDFSPEGRRHLQLVGQNLQRYRTLAFVSSGLGFLANIMISNSISDLEDERFRDALPSLIISGSALVTGFITEIIAVNHVEKAGKHLDRFADMVTDNRQQAKLKQAAANLQKYNKRRDKGLRFCIAGIVLTGGGAGLIAADYSGNGISTRGIGIGTVFIGGVSLLVGQIYSKWLASAALGSAGSNLKE